MPGQAIAYVTPRSTALRPVPADLLTFEGRGMLPRHQRMLVGGWAFSDGSTRGDREGIRRCFDLYDELDPMLLDRVSRISVASIIGELEQLVGS